MLVLRDPCALEQTDLDRVPAAVRALIEQRLQELSDYADAELAFFIVVEPGDTAAAIDAELGFPILVNRFDGTRYGESDFTPSWDVLEEHDDCFELVYVLGDDGHGVQVFVLKRPGVLPELLDMCATHAPAREHTPT